MPVAGSTGKGLPDVQSTRVDSTILCVRPGTLESARGRPIPPLLVACTGPAHSNLLRVPAALVYDPAAPLLRRSATNGRLESARRCWQVANPRPKCRVVSGGFSGVMTCDVTPSTRRPARNSTSMTMELQGAIRVPPDGPAPYRAKARQRCPPPKAPVHHDLSRMPCVICVSSGVWFASRFYPERSSLALAAFPFQRAYSRRASTLWK